METNNLKVDVNSQPEEGVQTVGVVVHITDGENHEIISWYNKIEELLASWRLKSTSDKPSNSEKHTAFETLKYLYYNFRGEVFNKYLSNYIYEHEDIQEAIKKYPQGGFAIVGHIILQDESKSFFRVYTPEQVTRQIELDFSVIPYGTVQKNTYSESKRIKFSYMEKLLLQALDFVSMSNGGYIARYSNEEILEICSDFQRKDKQWIAQTLGKFIHDGLIDIEFYKIGGRIWRREIFINDNEYLEDGKVFHLPI